MATTTNTIEVKIAAGRVMAFSANGKAVLDIISGPLGAGYTSLRLNTQIGEKTLGPYSVEAVIRIRPNAGVTVTYNDKLQQVGVFAEVDPVTGIADGILTTRAARQFASVPLIVTGGDQVNDVQTATFVNGSGAVQWFRQDPGTLVITDIAGQTASTYTRAVADVDKIVAAYATSWKPTAAGRITRPGAPTAPQTVAATAGNQQATITWAAPASTNGGALLNPAYIVTRLPGGQQFTTNALTYTDTGLTNGTAYTYYVQAINAAGPSPSAASNSVTPVSGSTATLRQVATRTLINQVVASSATARSRVGSRTNPVDVTQLVLEYDNWYVEGFVTVPGSYNEINGSGTVTVEGAIEYPIGTFTRATVDGTVGGGNQATAAPGATARLVCNVTIPAGGVYRSTFWASSTGNLPYAGVGTTGTAIPATATPTFNAALNDITDIGAGLTSLVMASTGYSGSQNGLAIGWNRIMAVHSGVAVMNLGTSIDHGEAGMQDSAGAEGSAARSLVAANVAYTNMGVRGDSVQNFLTKGTKRAALQQYYTHILFGGPTNDVPLTLIAPDADTIYGYMQQQYAMFPGKKKFQCTVLPRAANDGSNGTGVTRAGNPIRVALNNLIKANSAGLDGYFDLCPPVESAPDAGTWKTGALTTDGTHPLQAGYLTIKNANIITAAALGSP